MKVVFLDRDGVINRYPGHGEYVTKVKDFHFLPGSLQAIKKLTENGFIIFVISNQAGVSRGLYTRNKLNRINRHMLRMVRRHGGKIKRVFYCTHTQQDNCECRKPKIGSIKVALQLLNKTLGCAKQTYLIGDAEIDILTGHNAGCKTIFVLSGRSHRADHKSWTVAPDYIAKNLLEAVKIIEYENSCHSHLSWRRTYQSR